MTFIPLGAAVAVVLAFASPHANAQSTGGVLTKGAFVQRYFLDKFKRPPAARRYVHDGVESLPAAERYQAVVKTLGQSGVMVLTGTKADQPLTRVEFITLTYLLTGENPKVPYSEQKAFLKARGVLQPSDVGHVNSFQGDVTFTRLGTNEAVKVTGAEPVLFKDLDETDIGARLELKFDDGSTLTIGEDTALHIDEMVYDPKTKKRSILLRVSVGTILVKAAKNTHPGSRFEVRTPTMVSGIRGTEFTVSVAESGLTRVITLEGSVGVRPVAQGEYRPTSRAERQQGAASETGSVKEASTTTPETIQETVVGAGQTTEVTAVTTTVQTVTATTEDIQKVVQATKVVAPTQFAAVSTTDVSKTEEIVQVEVKESSVGIVETQRKIREQLITKPLEDDKGVGEAEITTAGSVGDGALSTAATPTAGAGPLAGLSGLKLKNTFLALSDLDQLNLFGTLTTTQQLDLNSRLTQQETEDVLDRFRRKTTGGLAFTSAQLDSLLDFGASATAAQIGFALDNITRRQAVAFSNCDGTIRRCIDEGERAFFTDSTDSVIDELSKFGAEVATSLSQELNRLAVAGGGTLANPSQASSIEQLLLATVSSDTIVQSFSQGSANSSSDLSFPVAEEILINIVNTPDNLTINSQDIQDIFGGALRPNQYSDNGGYQAGQIRNSALGSRDGKNARIDVSARINALNNNGFLAYAVQVEEDIVNAAALTIRKLSGGSTPAFLAGTLDTQIDTQLDLGAVRENDATLAQQADARAGIVLFNSDGNRVRVQQYVYRPPSDSNEVRITSISLGENGNANEGVTYVDLRVTFQSGQLSGKTALQIRDLPWNSYFSVLYTGGSPNAGDCTSTGCELAVGSPLGSPLLSSLRMEMGNPLGDYIREELTGFGSQVSGEVAYDYGTFVSSSTVSNFTTSSSFKHQHPTTMKLTVRKAGQTKKTFDNNPTSFDPRLGTISTATGFSSSSIPSGDYRVVPDDFLGVSNNGARPKSFTYVTNDGGTIVNYPIVTNVLGNSISSSTAGRQASTCGSSGSSSCNSLKFNTVWDLFRLNQTDSTTNLQNSGGSADEGLPTIDIGANALEIIAPRTVSGGTSNFGREIRNVFIPFPRMIWRGESGF